MPQQQAQGLEEESGVFGRAQVRLTDNLHQRHTRPVDIHQRVRFAEVVAAVVQLGDVLFEVDAGDADALGTGIGLDVQPAMLREGQVVLRNLVALHQVGVVVVLAVELGVFRYVAIQREGRPHGEFDRLLVDDRQRAGQTEAHRADQGVGRCVGVLRVARTEHLAGGKQLRVDFQANHHLVIGGRRGARRGCSCCHHHVSFPRTGIGVSIVALSYCRKVRASAQHDGAGCYPATTAAVWPARLQGRRC